jgi:hypothetical protein
MRLAQKIKRALEISDKQGLVRDRAIVEAVLGSVLVSEGKMKAAFISSEGIAGFDRF